MRNWVSRWPSQSCAEIGWRARETIDSGLEHTVRWYLDNEAWWRRVLDGSYRLERIGTAKAPS